MTKEDVKDVAVATAKAAVSIIPIGGAFLSEYIGLAQEKIANKRMLEWTTMVEQKLLELDCDMQKLSNDELFFTALNITTSKALKEIHNEKKEYFANALYNTFTITDLSEEKKLVFFNLLEKYTLISIKLLKLYSKNNHKDSDYVIKSGTGTITTTHPGQEKAMTYILKYIKEFNGEKELVQNLSTQLFYDGLIEEIDFNMPEYPQESRRKRTTSLGDDFLRFIID